MVWMNEAFKSDKRFLKLQLKRGKMKRRDIEAIMAALPDVSRKAESISLEEETMEPGDAASVPSTESEIKGES
jgi:hypothetical protein